MSGGRWVALGSGLVLLGLLLGMLLAAPRVPTVDAPGVGTPVGTSPHRIGSVPSSGRLPLLGGSW